MRVLLLAERAGNLGVVKLCCQCDPGPLAERIRRDKRELSDRSSDDSSSDDSSSDHDSCGSCSTSEANDIFDTLDDHL